MSTTDTVLHITAVERDTGIPKDTLRVWERRYGFPRPSRNDNGERTYPAVQVATLRLVKQLVDAGHRPNRVVGLDTAALRQLLETTGTDSSTALPADAAAVLDALRAHDPTRVQETLRGMLLRHGLERFVVDHLAPLITAVGEAWAGGRLTIHEEHLFSEQADRLLAQAIGQQPALPPRAPTLLATLPGEQHRLGLRMAEALFVARGLPCVSLGPDLPVDQLVDAALRFGAATVALSISSSGATPNTARAVSELRVRLSETTALWLGGRGAARLRPRPPAGTLRLDTLEALAAQIDRVSNEDVS